MKNRGLLFIKPHAVTEKTIAFVEKAMKDAGISIEKNGKLTGEEIDNKRIVDRHYFAISNTAMTLKPSNLVISESGKEDFAKKFGKSWEAVIAENKVYNSADYMEQHSLENGRDLTAVWTSGEFQKLGPGLYVCKTSDNTGEYIINGFYPGMREKFADPGAEIIWYTIEFDRENLSWADFRGKFVGATDPSKAAAGSLREQLFNNYRDYDLNSQPTMSDNGIHASAGPIEGMRERMVWAGVDPTESELGKTLLQKGINTLDSLLENGEAGFRDAKGPVFDITEDVNTDDILADLRV